jgi:hypothetical protein
MKLRRGSILALALALAPPIASAASWSAAATLKTCAPAADPKVVFPFSTPSKRSGSGAILWLGGPPSCSGKTAGSTTLDSATLQTDDLPSVPRAIILGQRLVGPLVAATTAAGQVVAIVGENNGLSDGASEALIGEGFAGSLPTLRPLGGPARLVATADGYIGDTDVVSAARTSSGRQVIELRQQRHYATSFANPVALDEGVEPITALAVSMDFRADSLVLWAQAGEVHAQWITNAGRVFPAQVLGPGGYAPQMAGVLSDNNHAFAMWTDEPPPGVSGETRIYLEYSGSSVRYPSDVAFSSTPSTLTTFTEPPAQRLTPGSIALVRMTPSEGVLAAWTLVQHGSYVVDAASLVSTHALPAATLSQPGTDLRLAALATGPHDDAVAVLERAPRDASGFDTAQQAILAARTVPGGPGGIAFEKPTQLAAAGSNSAPSVAIDPDSDRAVVAWQTMVGGLPTIAYAVRSRP